MHIYDECLWLFMMIWWDVSWLLILSRLQEFRAMARCCPPCDYQVIPCTIIFQAVVALIAIGPRDFLAKRGMEAFFGNAVDEALKSYSIMNAWCEHNIMHKLFLRCVKHLGKTKDVWHVLVTVKWKCSSAKVNMAVVRRRSLSPVCPMGSCLSRSGPSPMALYVRDSKTRRRISRKQWRWYIKTASGKTTCNL